MRKLLAFFRDVLSLLGSDRLRLLPILIVLLLSSFLDLLGLGLIGGYISLLSLGTEAVATSSLAGKVVNLFGSGDPVWWVGGTLIVLFSVKASLGIVAQRLILAFSLQQMMSLRVRLFSVMQSMAYQDFVRSNSADLVRAIMSYTTQFNGVIMGLLKLVGDAILAVAILTFLSFLEPLMMVSVFVAGITLVFLWDRVFRRKLVVRGQQMNEADGLLLRGVQEAVQGFKELKILRGEGFFAGIVADAANRSKVARLYTGTISAAPRFVVEWLAVFFIVALSWTIYSREGSGESIFSTLGLFAIAAVRLAPLGAQAVHSITQLRASKPAIDGLVAELKSADPKLKTNRYTTRTEQVNFEELTFVDVGLGHNRAQPPLMSGVTFTIRRGEWIGIIGDSGSGKTTLIDTMLGLLEPQGGEILFNTQPLQSVLSNWQSKVAYIPQETLILDASLAQNVALGKGADQRLRDVLKKARLDDLVDSLPQGVKERLGERGALISGGQRQRVALARALFHNREVLILDEATSALDLNTERSILKELRSLGSALTVIVVSHRPETLEFCDVIYKVDRGTMLRQQSSFE